MSKNAGQAEKTANSKKADKPEKTKKLIKLAAVEPIASTLPEDLDPEELVFAFDIGTRTVVGVVGIAEEHGFKILATEVVEHKNRAMMDGQVHDIDQVARAAREVKEKLEARLGVKFKRAAIAAAGRVLKTCQARVEKNLEPGREIDQEIVSSLEIEGIQQAQMMLDMDTSRDEGTQFYCVGYSVINYYLNGYVISRLTGHKGKTAGADILATFLPHIVVDSLYTVINRIGLEVSSLTLEPIAAINVTIPQDLRLLNLALVDIGAGTSDIALTRDGSVIAYAMAPIAGDEITETISQHYLVDFNTGEKIKLSLSSSKKSITFKDILKIKHIVDRNELLETIKPTVELLAGTISDRILEYNGKTPNAVFLIGGGSQVPGLAGLIANRLELPKDRVVVRGRDVIHNVRFSDKKLSGPESITPYGIAVTAHMQGNRDFLPITVNGKKVKLFNSKKLTVADALILVGFNPGQLIGRTGRSITYSLDGQSKTARGEYGKASEIYVNDEIASIDTKLKYGDSIDIVPARDGKDAAIRVFEAVPQYFSAKVSLNGRMVEAGTTVHVNGDIAAADRLIKDGDSLATYAINTVGDLLRAGGIAAEEYEVTVNGETAELDQKLTEGDRVEYCIPTPSPAEDHSIFNDSNIVNIVGEISESNPESSGSRDKKEKTGLGAAARVVISVNGKDIALTGDKSQYIFVDIFNYIDFDLTRPKGSIVLMLNGRTAAFTDAIRSGDVVEIYWK